MHVNDFREDLEPTLAQWRAIAQGMCKLAGEPAPTHRAGALELILRLEAEPAERAAAAPVIADDDLARRVAADPSLLRSGAVARAAHRDGRSRTGGRA